MAHNGLTRKLPRSLVPDAPGSRPPMADPRELAPLDGVGFRHWLCATLDRVILAMAVAGAQDDLAMLDPHYAEGMVLVFDDYLGRTPVRRMPVDE
jgi:hypothetical protein